MNKPFEANLIYFTVLFDNCMPRILTEVAKGQTATHPQNIVPASGRLLWEMLNNLAFGHLPTPPLTCEVSFELGTLSQTTTSSSSAKATGRLQGMASCHFPGLYSFSQRDIDAVITSKWSLLYYIPKHGHKQVHEEDVSWEHVYAHQGNGNPLWEAGLVVGIQFHTQGLGLISRKGAAVKVVGGTSGGNSGEQTVSPLPFFLLGLAPDTATEHNTHGLFPPSRTDTKPCFDALWRKGNRRADAVHQKYGQWGNWFHTAGLAPKALARATSQLLTPLKTTDEGIPLPLEHRTGHPLKGQSIPPPTEDSYHQHHQGTGRT